MVGRHLAMLVGKEVEAFVAAVQHLFQAQAHACVLAPDFVKNGPQNYHVCDI